MRVTLRERGLLGLLVLMLGAGGWYALGIRPVRKRASEWRLREERALLSLEAAGLARHEIYDLDALKEEIGTMETALSGLDREQTAPERPAEGECPVCRVASEIGVTILESASSWVSGGHLPGTTAGGAAIPMPTRSGGERAISAPGRAVNRLVFAASFPALLRFSGELKALRPPPDLDRIDVQIASDGNGRGGNLLRGELTWRAVP